MTNLFKTFAAAFLSLALLAGPAVADDAPMVITGATTVDAEGVISLIEKHNDLVLLDNRREADFQRGHIEGAVRLLDTDVTADSLAAAIASKDTPVLMYCNGLKCGRAAKAAEAAVGLGDSKVFYYALGMTEWSEKGLPVATN